MNRTTESIGAGILLILLIGFLGFAGNNLLPRSQTNPSTPTPTIAPGNPVNAPPITSDAQLQLRTFTPPTDTPTPMESAGSACHDSNQGTAWQLNSNGVPECPGYPTFQCPAYLVECQGGVCVKQYASGQTACPTTFNNNWCRQSYGGYGKDGIYCIGKPVIYLYPTHKMQVQVTLDIPGLITQSIPTYPAGGWKNITAYPGGDLSYQGHSYTELYYESSVHAQLDPKTGLVLPRDQLSAGLSSFVTRLGLLPKERDEFLSYWLPRLSSMNTPYVFVSLFTPSQKEAIDHVRISPKPDTTIAFLVYFKGLKTNKTVPALHLPAVPKRNGFTMVEWGGTIAQD